MSNKCYPQVLQVLWKKNPFTALRPSTDQLRGPNITELRRERWMEPVSYKILRELKNGRSQSGEMKAFVLMIVSYYTSTILDICVIYLLGMEDWVKRINWQKRFILLSNIWPRVREKLSKPFLNDSVRKYLFSVMLNSFRSIGELWPSLQEGIFLYNNFIFLESIL